MPSAITQDYQVTIAPLANESLEFFLGTGTPFQIDKFIGLDVDDIRTDDAERLLDHGSFPGLDLLGSRGLTLGIVTFGTAGDPNSGLRTPELVVSNQDALVGAWTAASIDASTKDPANPSMVLRYKLPGQAVRRFIGRCRKVARNDDTVPVGYGTATLEFVALDPRQYAEVMSAPELVVAATSAGGLTFPVTFPITFTPVNGGDLVVTNLGNMSTPPVVTITGPVVNPRVDNVEDGTFLQVNLTLSATDFLVINTDTRQVLLGGTGSRSYLLAIGSKFPRVRPGTNTFRLSGTWATGDQPRMSVGFRSAWL